MPRVSRDGAHWVECRGQATVETHLDDREIQAQLDALPATGGSIYLSEGTFTLGKQISRAIDNVNIIGCGRGTVVNLDASTAVISVGTQTGWKLMDFDTDAGGVDIDEAANCRCRVYRQGVLIAAQPELTTFTAKFTQTATKNTYGVGLVIPAGSFVYDVRWMNEVVWNGTGAATMECGDADDADGFFAAVDLKTLPIADVAGAGGYTTSGRPFTVDGDGAVTYAGRGVYGGLTKYYAADGVITTTVVTADTDGTAGRSRLVILYSKPFSRTVTMAVS